MPRIRISPAAARSAPLCRGRSSCTWWPRWRRPSTKRAAVRATPFTSGGQVSLTTATRSVGRDAGNSSHTMGGIMPRDYPCVMRLAGDRHCLETVIERSEFGSNRSVPLPAARRTKRETTDEEDPAGAGGATLGRSPLLSPQPHQPVPPLRERLELPLLLRAAHLAPGRRRAGRLAGGDDRAPVRPFLFRA